MLQVCFSAHTLRHLAIYPLTDTFDVALGAESAQVIAHGTGLDAQLLTLLIGHCRAEALRQKLPARIMRQLPQRSQRRIYLVIIFALCIGTVVLVVTQSRDVMDEYYEHELKEMLDAL